VALAFNCHVPHLICVLAHHRFSYVSTNLYLGPRCAQQTMAGPPLTCRTGLCRRRGWRDPLYETYRSSSGYTCLVLVNGREYQTDLAYESDGLAQENAAMRAFMVCRNFSVNGGMLARNGVVQGLPANEHSGRHRRRGGGRSHSVNLSSSSSTASSE
jgi:hypothetical protein